MEISRVLDAITEGEMDEFLELIAMTVRERKQAVERIALADKSVEAAKTGRRS